MRSVGLAGRLILIVALGSFVVGCSSSRNTKARTVLPDPDMPPPQMRAMFVASAYNIDWPTRQNLHYRVQTDQIHSVVERAKQLHCNVIMLQVRGFGDRIHRDDTAKEKWSEWLNHTHDPDPKNKKYDPLAEWVKACHAEGIELHAWVNAFRVNETVNNLPTMPHPDRRHKNLDWKDEKVRKYLVDDVLDGLIKVKVNPPTMMYASADGGATTQPNDEEDDGIDGVVIDQCGATQPRVVVLAPQGDSETDAPKQQKQGKNGRTDSQDAKMLDQFVDAAFKFVHTTKGRKFGITPDAGAEDAKRWLQSGKVNYVAPQLYMTIENGFVETLNDWLKVIPQNVGTGKFRPIVVPALFTVRAQSPTSKADKPWPASEIENQIQAIRDTELGDKKRASGEAHCSYSALKSSIQGGPYEDNIGDKLAAGQYQDAALVPACTQSPKGKPMAPHVTLDAATRKATWKPIWSNKAITQRVRCWAVFEHNKQSNSWEKMQVFPPSKQDMTVGVNTDGIAVKLIDPYNVESDFAKVQMEN